MGERIAALAALTRIRAIAEQIPTEAPTAPGAAATIPEQGVEAVSRPLQEIAGLRHAAETTSKRVTPNTNAQRADVVGSALGQETETTVPAPNAPEPKQAAADVVASNTRNQQLSLNRAVLETLRGGFETARATVPSIEEQREAIREALAARRAEVQPERPTRNEQARAEAPAAPRTGYNPEADALGVLAGAPPVRPVQQRSYAVGGEESGTSNGKRLNFLA